MEESARAGTLDKVLLETDSHDQFLRSLMSSLVSTTKASNSVPKGLDYNYHNSFADFRKVRDGSSSKATELMVQLLEYTRPTSSDSGPMQLSEEESDPYLYGQIIDTIDLLLDRAERTLARSDADNFGREVSSHLRETMLLDKDRIIRENIKSIPKPQLKFLFDIDNSRQTIFAPKLKRKFHSRMEYKAAIQYIEDEPESAFYPHPYEFELQRLEYPAYLLKKPKTTEMVLPDALRPYVFVGTEEELMRAIEELKSCKEIAVDCEHHSVRSFQGLTCLMQLSSRTKDYIIDTLALRLVLSQLGEIFANPKIVKVFHGCESDIYWLQRDFGLYVVNCFDTYVGAKQLRFSALSLAHLVRYYCGVTLDKTHQLSDWRQRPLTEDMLVYARRDTQYLLSIFDAMRRDLWNAASPTVSAAYNSKEDSATGSVDFIEAVLAGSKRLCLNRYAKPVFDPLGYQALVALDKQVIKATNGHAQLTPAQESVLAALWDWRDATARAEDESVTFIMANSEMIRLSLSIPRSIDSVHEKMASQALVLLTPYVLEHLDDVIQVVNAAASKNSGDGQQRETWKALSGSTVLSASSEAKKPSTNASSASASAVSSTIFAFNPSAANATASSSLNILTNNINNGSHSNTLGSPVLPLDEMFRRAGWKTPLNAPATTKAGLAINDEDAEEEELDENTERLVSSASTAAATASNAARTSGTSAPVTGTPVQSLGPLASWSPLIFEAIKPTSVHPSVLFATAPTSSNSSTNPMSTSNSNLNNLRASGGSQISEANRRLVSKSLESLYKSVESKVGLEKCLRDIAFSDPHAASTTDVAASAEDGMADMSEDIVDNDGNVLPEIPRSFEEIYRLSGKLRHKKQQKTQQQLQQGDLPASKVPANKRSFASANSALEAFGSVLDGDDSDDSDNEEGDLQSYLAKRNLAPSAASLSNTGSVAATVPAVGKAGKASNNAAKSTAGAGSDVTNLAATAGENREIVDQTLSFAREIGWVPNDEAAQALREEHFRVLSAQQGSVNQHNNSSSASSKSGHGETASNNSSSNNIAPTLHTATSATGASNANIAPTLQQQQHVYPPAHQQGPSYRDHLQHNGGVTSSNSRGPSPGSGQRNASNSQNNSTNTSASNSRGNSAGRHAKHRGEDSGSSHPTESAAYKGGRAPVGPPAIAPTIPDFSYASVSRPEIGALLSAENTGNNSNNNSNNNKGGRGSGGGNRKGGNNNGGGGVSSSTSWRTTASHNPYFHK